MKKGVGVTIPQIVGERFSSRPAPLARQMQPSAGDDDGDVTLFASFECISSFVT